MRGGAERRQLSPPIPRPCQPPAEPANGPTGQQPFDASVEVTRLRLLRVFPVWDLEVPSRQRRQVPADRELEVRDSIAGRNICTQSSDDNCLLPNDSKPLVGWPT